MIKVVLDTNVGVAGLRSRNGVSAVVLELVAEGRVGLVLSGALLDEYEEVLQRPEQRSAHGLSDDDVARFLRGLVGCAELVPPRLEQRLVLVRDPDDAAVAEAAEVVSWGTGDTTTEAAYPLRMPTSLKRAAERLAAEDGVPLVQWINVAVAQKVGAIETAERLRGRYGEARPDDLRGVLAKVPDAPPVPGDELPDDLSAVFGRDGAKPPW